MTTVQLQRIIGVALLLSVVIGIAMLLIGNADDGDSAEEKASKLAFESERVETKLPYVSEAIINLETAAKDSEELALEQKEVEANPAPAPAPAPAPDKTSTIEPAKVAPPAKVSVPEKIQAQAKVPVPPKTPVAPKKVPEPAKAAVSTKPSVSTKPAAPTKVTQAQPAEKWVIQLASFSVKANADALNSQAKQMGYKSVIENTDTANGKIYRVRIEPMADKQKAQAVASEINNKMKLSTQVLQE